MCQLVEHVRVGGHEAHNSSFWFNNNDHCSASQEADSATAARAAKHRKKSSTRCHADARMLHTPTTIPFTSRRSVCVREYIVRASGELNACVYIFVFGAGGGYIIVRVGCAETRKASSLEYVYTAAILAVHLRHSCNYKMHSSWMSACVRACGRMQPTLLFEHYHTIPAGFCYARQALMHPHPHRAIRVLHMYNTRGYIPGIHYHFQRGKAHRSGRSQPRSSTDHPQIIYRLSTDHL